MQSIHNKEGFTALAQIVGVGQSYNDYLHFGESEKSVAAKSVEPVSQYFLPGAVSLGDPGRVACPQSTLESHRSQSLMSMEDRKTIAKQQQQ